MGKCTVCSHHDRAAIDGALVAGTPYRNIAERFSVSLAALARHREHISAAIAQREEAHALDVVKQLLAINGAMWAILTAARKTGDADAQFKAVDRIQRQIELQAKLLGDLDERPQVNVLVLPEWLAMRTAILAALTAYPEARDAVVDAVARLRGMQGATEEQEVSGAESLR